jgi:hypothetical protein
MAQGEHDIEKVVEGTEELGVSSQLDAEEVSSPSSIIVEGRHLLADLLPFLYRCIPNCPSSFSSSSRNSLLAALRSAPLQLSTRLHIWSGTKHCRSYTRLSVTNFSIVKIHDLTSRIAQDFNTQSTSNRILSVIANTYLSSRIARFIFRYLPSAKRQTFRHPIA